MLKKQVLNYFNSVILWDHLEHLYVFNVENTKIEDKPWGALFFFIHEIF